MRGVERASLGWTILTRYARARWLMATVTLPAAVEAIGAHPRGGRRELTPRQLSRGVDKVLRIGRRPLRCLPRALVLYSLLIDGGHEPRLVIGVQEPSSSPIAHAWVEIDGEDVGPPPGRGPHSVMAIYPLPAGR